MVEKSTIKFLKTREVKSPLRAYPTDAGIDFFVPVFNKEFIKDLLEKNLKTFNIKEPKENSMTIHFSSNYPPEKAPLETKNFFGFDIEEGLPYFILEPQKGVMIPSGIKCRMAEEGRALIAANKSGVATKTLLTFGAQIVDYTYQGEIHLHLINNSRENVKIYQGQKIIQFIETPVFNSEVKIFEIEDVKQAYFYLGLENDRGDGGFGSTDKK